MSQRERVFYLKLGLVIYLVSSSVFTSRNCTLAQIIPDATLGAESSVVTPTNIDGLPTEQIDGGETRGANLFHSFEKFSVPTGNAAYFNNAANIQNIISRVTGSSVSNIDGLIRANDTANLFLLNPNGIIFGPNASLNIGGSFLASTASSMNFADGTQFSATAPQTSPLLTVSVPIGLQFGRAAAAILVQDSRSDLGLLVNPGKTLGLVGGEVTLEGAYLNAPGGRIELGSVASNSLVKLNPMVKGWFLEYEGVQNFQNIQLTQGSFNKFGSVLDASGKGGGDIRLQGRQVMLTDSSQILSTTEGAEPGGNLTVNASESVLIRDSVLSSATTAVGKGGAVTITTGRLLLTDRAYVSTESSGEQEPSGKIRLAEGPGGNLTLNASESVELINGSSVSSLTQGSGDAGDVRIATRNLIVQDGAEVNVSSKGTGDAGDLQVQARSISVDEQGKLIATSTSGKGGGNIRLQDLDLLLLRRNSEISTNAGGNGNGGNITINTELLAALENSKLSANAVGGQGGNVQITTQGLFLSPNSKITASSERGPKFNGVVKINRPDIDPTQGLVTLPAELVEASGLIATGCAPGGESEFTVTGRSGLPPNPGEPLSSDEVWEDLRLAAATVNQHLQDTVTATSLSEEAAVPIVPATGWVFNTLGEVTLTAQTPSATLNIPWMQPPTCHKPDPSS